MNTNDPKSSKDSNPSFSKPPEKQPLEPFPSSSSTPSEKPSAEPAHPLSSSHEPTTAYPSDLSHTYSSDPSQYAYSDKQTPSDSSKVYANEPLDAARISREDKRSAEHGTQQENHQTFHQSFEEKSRDPFGNPKTKKTEENYSYAKSHKEHTITYILLAVGLLLLLLFNNMFGGLMIGMVAGYYFSAEIIDYLRNMSQMFGGQDHLRYVVLTALVLGFFIAAPGIFIGAAIVAAFKQVMQGPRPPSNR